jgi:hypothetical protein
MKSAALAKRLSERFDRPVAYGTLPISMMQLPGISLLIGCVDNGPARADIATKADFRWWVDAGNGDNYGQILIGNGNYARFLKEKQLIDHLPSPAIQRPEILLQAPGPEAGCVAVPDQGPTINNVMAALVVEVVRRLIEGTCPWLQLLVDMQHGLMTPIMATPEKCREIMHTRSKEKVQIVEEEKR